MSVAILPSLLAADIGHLADAAVRSEAGGADALHLDIMDGHFVPNISMGPNVVAMARRTVKLPLSVHLMLTHPDRHIERFAEAGSTSIMIHVEAESALVPTLQRIEALGVVPGLTINPDTPLSALLPYLEYACEFLVMTVRPGFGGQTFMREPVRKIEDLRQALDRAGRDCPILVDGGIGRSTIGLCAAAGATHFVAGNSLFTAPDLRLEIAALRHLAEEAQAQRGDHA